MFWGEMCLSAIEPVCNTEGKTLVFVNATVPMNIHTALHTASRFWPSYHIFRAVHRVASPAMAPGVSGGASLFLGADPLLLGPALTQ